jgi:hypothetical protein
MPTSQLYASFFNEMQKLGKAEKTAKVIAHIGGPSGAGKTTILEKLKRKNPSLVVKDLDDFDRQGRQLLWGGHPKKQDFTDKMFQQLHSKRDNLLADFLSANKDRQVVLGGHHIEGRHVSNIPEGEKILLDTGALRSAWRNVRRSKRGKGHKRYRDIIFRQKKSPGRRGNPSLYSIGSEDIQQLRSMGYAPKSPKEILNLIENTVKTSSDTQY